MFVLFSDKILIANLIWDKNEGDEMTQQELKVILDRLGLEVPKNEQRDIIDASKYIEEMLILIRKSYSFSIEPASLVSFPGH